MGTYESEHIKCQGHEVVHVREESSCLPLLPGSRLSHCLSTAGGKELPGFSRKLMSLGETGRQFCTNEVYGIRHITCGSEGPGLLSLQSLVSDHCAVRKEGLYLSCPAPSSAKCFAWVSYPDVFSCDRIGCYPMFTEEVVILRLCPAIALSEGKGRPFKPRSHESTEAASHS